jgi:DNA replication protein DnaC
MIQVSKTLKLQSDIQKRKKESLYELLKDPTIKDFANKYHLSMEKLGDYWAELIDYKEDRDQCESCTSLESCPKVSKGLCRVLTYENGVFDMPLKYCKYGKMKEQESHILSHFLYNNVSSSLALTDLSNNQYALRATELSNNNKAALKSILAYVMAPSEKGLYLYGESGTGKTVLMAGLMNKLARTGKDVGICHFPTFLLDMKTHFGNYSDDSFLSHILNIPYLLLDGLGEENVTSWSRDEVLLTILSYRDINHLPTFVTSMYTIDELKDVYLLRKNDKTEKIRAQKIALKIKSLCTQLSLESNKR